MATNFWNGDKAKFLLDKLELKSGNQILTLTADPTFVATDAPIGSFGPFSGALYIKGDNGLTTNWFRVVTEVELLFVVNKLINLSSTGVLDGGDLSLVSGTQFTVSDGYGTIVDNTDPSLPIAIDVVWAGLGNITVSNLGTQAVYIAIDSAGLVVQSVTPWTPTQRRNLIILGSGVITGGALVFIASQPVKIIDVSGDVYDLADSVGIVNLNGNVIGDNGANLELSKTSGSMYSVHANYDVNHKDPSTLNQASFVTTDLNKGLSMFYDDGAGGVIVEAQSTVVKPTFWDDGTGTLNTVNANNWSVIRVYLAPELNLLFASYGRDEYNNLNQARQRFQTEDVVAGAGLEALSLRGWIFLRGGASDLTSAGDALFLRAGKFGDNVSGGASGIDNNQQETYENSPNGDIVLDPTVGVKAVRDNATPIGTNLFEVTDNADASKFFETDVNGSRSQNIDNGKFDILPTNPKDFYINTMRHYPFADAETGNNATYDGGGTIDGGMGKNSSTPINGTESLTYVSLGGTSVNDYFNIKTITLAPNQVGTTIAWEGIYEYDGLDDEIRIIIWDVANSQELNGTLNTFKAAASSTKFSISVDVPSNATDIKFGGHVKSMAAVSVLEIANCRLTTDPFVFKEVATTQEIGHLAATNTLLDLTGEIRFDLANVTSTGDSIIIPTDNAGAGRTDFIATKKCTVDVSASGPLATINRQLGIVKNTVVVVAGTEIFSANRVAGMSGQMDLEEGDEFSITVAVNSVFDATAVTSGTDRFSLLISATAFEENIISYNAKDVADTNVRASTFNSFSGNVYTFTTLENNQGGTVTPTIGTGEFLIEESGIYNMTLNSNPDTAGVTAAICKNETSISYGPNTLGTEEASTADDNVNVVASAYLVEGDIIRCLGNGGGINIAGRVNFTIVKVGQGDLMGIPSSVLIPSTFETNFLTSNFTAGGAMPDLTFNVEIGKAYEVKVNSFINSGTSVGQTVRIDVAHDSATILLTGINTTTGTIFDTFENSSVKFIATATTVTFSCVVTSTGGQIRGNSTLSQTWAQLTLLPNTIEV